jgi:hypothetical protein
MVGAARDGDPEDSVAEKAHGAREIQEVHAVRVSLMSIPAFLACAPGGKASGRNRHNDTLSTRHESQLGPTVIADISQPPRLPHIPSYRLSCPLHVFVGL